MENDIKQCDGKVKLLFGTGNQAKLSVMKKRMKKIGIELIGLNELKAEGMTIPEVVESGNTPLENARLKALSYYRSFQMPVFSCDTGLYFENVPEKVQPGVHVRNVNGKCLSDDEMVEYYAGLVSKYGNLVARYQNAICFVMDETHIYESMDLSIAGEKFILTGKPHSAIRKKGFPLDSMSIHIKTNKYYYDLTEDEWKQFAVEDGFLEFFRNIFPFENSSEAFGRSKRDSMLRLEMAGLGDAQIAAELAIQMWESNTVEELTQEFYEYIREENGIILLAKADGHAVGFAQCGLRHDYVEGTDSSPVGYLEGIFVKEEYRKKGLARDMVEVCQKWAREQGCAEFASDCELDNETSLRFHIKMGFAEANRIICFTKKI